ncbi:preprotein translocase subunit YajC [Actinomycetospora sp. TBRC 11914]|uniref:preprotein translocase subunit YajC n=1 Tax=Actinomycetospora sp. TBRC 11914 TaxID=2729387 RepID=UPI00145EBFF7|nr:preprotein translocase subunit YajC [Actinomycetospora sp. TBRC 11914]NMO93772.1 preprotein translocase subunit YajC [Actinomycetospora sp. TBRC 11914]
MDLLFPLLIVFMIGMIFFSNRQRKKQQQQQQSLQDSIAVGDVVVMTCGVSGTVVDTDDEKTIDLEIAPEVITTWLRAAVREKLSTDLDTVHGGDHLEHHDLDAEHAELTDTVRPTGGAAPHAGTSNGVPAAASEPHDATATGFSDPTATPSSNGTDGVSAGSTTPRDPRS